DSPRPLPYDLMKAMISELEGTIDRVVVTDLSQDVFYARTVVSVGGRSIDIDSRPSDAIALAVRSGSSIFVEEGVMERAGVSLESEAEVEEAGQSTLSSPERSPSTPAEDDRLTIFRDFINTLDLDDFERGRSS